MKNLVVDKKNRMRRVILTTSLVFGDNYYAFSTSYDPDSDSFLPGLLKMRIMMQADLLATKETVAAVVFFLRFSENKIDSSYWLGLFHVHTLPILPSEAGTVTLHEQRTCVIMNVYMCDGKAQFTSGILILETY